MKGEKKKAVNAENQKVTKFIGFGTTKDMVVRELNVPISEFTKNDIHNGMAVVAKDAKGEYVTSSYFVG